MVDIYTSSELPRGRVSSFLKVHILTTSYEHVRIIPRTLVNTSQK